MKNLTVCIDAGPLIQMVAFPGNLRIRRLWERWEAEKRRVAAPPLLFCEAASVLYGYQKLGLLSHATVAAALEAAQSCPIEIVDAPDLHRAAVEIASRLDLVFAYDAYYLALAQRLGGELWTYNKRLAAQSAEKGIASVHLITRGEG